MIRTGRVTTMVLLVVLVGALWYLIKVARGSSEVPIRRVSGVDALDECVGRATELGRPVHYTMGNTSTSGIDAQVFASLAILDYVARRCAEYETRIIVTNNLAALQPVTEEIVRQAFLSAGKTDEYRPTDIRYLSDNQMAYTSGCIATMHQEKIAANLMFGPFQAESLMFCETGYLLNAMQVGGTAFTHQLPFFVAACDYTLIGEELFAAGAYLSGNPEGIGSLLMQDVGRVISIALIVLGSVLITLGNDWVVRVLEK